MKGFIHINIYEDGTIGESNRAHSVPYELLWGPAPTDIYNLNSSCSAYALDSVDKKIMGSYYLNKYIK